MPTDDRDDIESPSPSSFKVGEVDRLSGFFTPVWESKRRLRAESPVPASAAPGSAPGSDGEPGAPSEAAGRQPSQPPPARRGAPAGPFVAATPPRASRPPVKGRASSAAARRDAAAPKVSPVPSKAAAHASAGGASPAAPVTPRDPGKTGAEREAALAAQPEHAPATGEDAGGRASTKSTRPGAPEPEPDSASGSSVSVRPVIPMPQHPGRTTPRVKASSSPPGAEPRLPGLSDTPPPGLQREPDARPSPPTSAPPARASWPAADQRALRAAGAAAVLHDKLRGKAVDSVDTVARHRETESEREALQRAAERAAATPPDPYPSHLLRALRRTLHLSVPLPQSVRAMIDKYRY